MGEDDASALTITDLIAAFTNAAFVGKKVDVLLRLLVNRSAEATVGDFDADAVKELFTLTLKLLTQSAAQATTTSSGSGGAVLVDLCLSLLCNLTVPEPNAQLLVDAHVVNTAAADEASPVIVVSPELTQAVDAFLAYDCQLMEEASSKALTAEEWGRADPWQHMASVLCNLARLEGGRRLLLRRSTGYMERLVRQIRSKNATRRRGCVGALRSCLFDNDIHWWLLHDVGVLPYMLLPLVVATPFTVKEKDGMDPVLFLSAEDPEKTWEPETDILLMLLESIVLFCQRRGIREELRKKKVYPICRNLDYLQENEAASSLILDIVNLLMRDEDPDTPVDGPGDAATTTVSSAAVKTTAATATVFARIPAAGDDYINTVD
jgi:hypothetical protein